MGLGPSLGSDLWYLMVGHSRQPGKDVAQIGVWIDASAAAGLDNGVDDCSALTGSGFSDEEPVLLADGGGANGVFDQVVIDLQPAIFQKHGQCGPLAQGIVDGLAQ